MPFYPRRPAYLSVCPGRMMLTRAPTRFLGKPGYPSAAELEALKTDLEKELREVGNEWNYHLVYGRRAV